jgi:hypothetical protein
MCAVRIWREISLRHYLFQINRTAKVLLRMKIVLLVLVYISSQL